MMELPPWPLSAERHDGNRHALDHAATSALETLYFEQQKTRDVSGAGFCCLQVIRSGFFDSARHMTGSIDRCASKRQPGQDQQEHEKDPENDAFLFGFRHRALPYKRYSEQFVKITIHEFAEDGSKPLSSQSAHQRYFRPPRYIACPSCPLLIDGPSRNR